MFKLLFLSTALLLTACVTYTPQPIYIFKPLHQQSKWLNGREVSKVNFAGIELLVYFESTLNDQHVFNVSVNNMSDSEVTIDHENFSFLLTNNETLTTITPVNPEQKVIDYQVKLSKEVARYKSLDTNLLIVDLIDTVTDVATIASPKTKQSIQNEREFDRKLEAHKESNESTHERKSTSINTLLHQWRNEALRKTTLAPGFQLRGDIYFPRFEPAESMNLSIRINNETVTIPYTKQKVGN